VSNGEVKVALSVGMVASRPSNVTSLTFSAFARAARTSTATS
jgi:hypothetical protein